MKKVHARGKASIVHWILSIHSMEGKGRQCLFFITFITFFGMTFRMHGFIFTFTSELDGYLHRHCDYDYDYDYGIACVCI